MTGDKTKSRFSFLSWFYIPMAIVVPIAAIIVTALLFYSRTLLKEGVADVRQHLTEEIINNADRIRKGINEQVAAVETLATLQGSEPDKVSAYSRLLLEKSEMLYAVRIGYDPDFLSALRSGKHPEYRLEDYQNALTPGEFPEEYCATIFRDQTGAIKTLDETDSGYQFLDSFHLVRIFRRGYWIDPYVSSMLHEQVCAYSTPFYYKGEFAGSLSAYFLVERMLRTDDEGADLHLDPNSLAMIILADNGKILYNTNKKATSYESIYSFVPDDREADLFPHIDTILSGSTGAVRIKNWADLSNLTGKMGIDIWTVYTPIHNGTDWVLAVAFDESVVLASFYRRLIIFWGASLAALFLITVVTTLIEIMIYKPVVVLSNISEQIEGGDDVVLAPERYTKHKTHFGRLARNFNRMVASLRKNIKTAGDEKAKRSVLEAELSIAQKIQKTLLPRKDALGDVSGCELDAVLIPAHFVAGDFYDFWQINDQKIALLIGDVSGKGVPAAMIMAATRTTIHQLTTNGKTTGEIITTANKYLQENNSSNMFSTVFFAIYDTKTGALQGTNAGHFPPVVLHRDGTTEHLQYAIDTVLGVFANFTFQTTTVVIAPGDTIFLCTDGVFDAANAEDERFERERFEEQLRKNPDRPVAEILRDVVSAIDVFSDQNKRDDITLLGFRRKTTETEGG